MPNHLHSRCNLVVYPSVQNACLAGPSLASFGDTRPPAATLCLESAAKYAHITSFLHTLGTMVFDVKRIFRISSDKHGRKEQQTDTDSPSEDDVYSQRIRNGLSNRPWASSSSTSLWNSSRSKDNQQSEQNQQNDSSSTRGVRKKASRIGRGKESGGYADKWKRKETTWPCGCSFMKS